MSMLLRRGLWREILLLRKCHTNPSFSPLQNRPLLPAISPHSIHSSPSSAAFFSSAVEVENHASEEIETTPKLENHVPEERGTPHELINEEGKHGISDKAEKCEGLIANNLEDEVRTLRAELEDQKALIKSLIQDVNSLKSRPPNGGKPMVSKVRLPEWTTFLEHLKNSEFLKDERKGSSKTSLFDDPASVKRALFKFSQVHESIYESLPQNDIKIIVQNGLVDDDQKAQASLKRLRKHYELDTQEEDNVSDLPSIQPKLSDVLRLLYSTIMLSQVDALAEDVKSSVAVLLKEIIKLSGTKKAKSKVPDAEKVKAILNKDKEMKTMAESDAKSEQWECPRCHFKNLDHKYRCVECSRKRPTKTYLAAEGKEDTNLTTDALDEELGVKLPLGGKAKPHRKEGSNSSTSDQEKDQETSVKTGALHDDDDVSHSDIDILDDILDDSDDTEEEKESGKKSTLSDLFNKRTSPSPMKKREDRNGRGQNSSARPSLRRKVNDEDDSDDDNDDSEDEPRARRGGSRSFLDEDSDDEDSRRPRSASRGFGDSSPKRTDKWDRNSNRQSGTRGGGGDSYDERRGGNGGWRGGRGGGRGGGRDRFGGGDRRDRNEDSYEERGSRFGGGGGGRSRGRGRSTRY